MGSLELPFDVIMQDDQEADELDVMDAPITQSAPGVNPSSAPRRSARQKTSIAGGSTGSANKKRKVPSSAIQPQSNKRAKLEQQKVKTGQNNEKRADRDTQRTHWLLRHRNIVEPLLPPNSTFFSTLQTRESSGRARNNNISYTPYHELEEQPQLINKSCGEMKDYQLKGLSFLVYMYRNGMNCILGDEMGLGKTLQTLSLFAYISEHVSGHVDPHLIVCPLSVLASWEAEAARWLPSFRTVRFHGPVNERSRLRKALLDGKYDIVLTTYDVFVTEDSWFKSRRWTYCVLDEGHKVKNSESMVSHKLQGIGAMYRLILTGTPVQNNLFELWSLFHFLYPNIFTPASEQRFRDSFNLERGSYSLPFVNAAKEFLSTVMLRRTKATVQLDIPPRIEQTIFIPLTEAQRFWTYRLLTKMDSLDLKTIFDPELTLDTANSGLAEGRREVLSILENQLQQQTAPTAKQKQTWKHLMNLLMQLRMVCDHPYLLRDAEPDPYQIGEHVVASSSKMICIDKILADVLPKGEKVLIFSQWYRMLDCLEDMLFLRGIKYARLDGSTSRPRRTLDIKLFQHGSSTLQVYLISTKAGGLGINLTKATTVIMADSDWNPQNDLQAIARAHRIGQKKTVQVYRLICGGSVEDQMLDRLRRKLFLSAKLMGSDNTGSNNGSDDTSMGAGELMDILRKGSSALVHGGGGIGLAKFLAAPIADILEASKAREDARDAKIKQELGGGDLKEEATEQLVHDAEEEEKRLLSGIAQVRCRLFEGKMVEHGKGVKKNKDIADEWVNLQKRQRNGKETVVIGGMTFVVDTSPIEVEVKAVPKKKTSRRQMDHEDYCNVCEDGGDLYCCNYCPRVFHASCTDIPKQKLKSSSIACSQHACWDCQRTTSDAGGMLFRCRTCPQAFCEDCIKDPFHPIGESIPEFELLNYSAPNAYFITCQDCIEQAEKRPRWRKEWEKRVQKAEKDLEEKYSMMT
ncbi:hypothetical protein VNI00_015448 [Paramarasmius palmivorus]|uniref:Uncharacterized protein n=1 Tax=Paramarasmius palmivorus TaxID=297713 RepID=A0AAW0BKX2_9AGAR